MPHDFLNFFRMKIINSIIPFKVVLPVRGWPSRILLIYYIVSLPG